ncbi:carboxylesterase/lipase family protein [Kineococcus terrestris]|uniref:carboxylesterase/lipase family protein n=1 Tax=Kineococcus terrestris TaxID=2044856 RepID=UPI0034DB0391
MGRVVVTTSGRVRGLDPVDGVEAFRGLPYAAPPVGRYRFQAPQPVPAHRGVREARTPSPVAPQDPRSGNGWTPASGGDYLTLDVFAPAGPAAPAAPPDGRPVLVWVHGGAYVTGAGSSPAYHPRAHVRRGTLVVSVNYRLGAEGFLAVPGAPGNRALRDQVAALEWVRDNVSAFGGDPARVTVAGESAGAGSVAALLCAPSARGLFRRAVAHSVYGDTVTPAVADDVARRVARAARVPATLAGFAGLPPVRLLAATEFVQREATSAARRARRGTASLVHVPVVGGQFLPEPLFDGPAAGGDPDVDLLVCHNDDEWRLFSLTGMGPTARTEDELGAFALAARLDADRFARYRAALPASATPRDVADALMTDAVFAEPTTRFAARHAARGGRTFSSRFAWRSPALGFRLGAAHAVDLPFAFGNPGGWDVLLHAVPVLELARRLPVVGPRVPGVWPTPAAARLSRRMVDAWTGFVHHGDPGWPAADTTATPVHVWDGVDRREGAEAATGPGGRRRVWQGVPLDPWDL